jgi:lysophospholipase L1-like esterase
VGGTPIESWIDAEAQHAKPELKGFFEAKNGQVFDEAEAKAAYEKQVAAWTEAVKKARAAGQTPPRKPRDPIALRATKGNVGGLFNGKINGLIPYAIRGALWYQGEANSQPEKARYYRHHLSLLVEDWRKRWGYEFPFAWVQLPNFSSRGDAWCEVREGMFQTLALPATGMAVTTDIGEEKDIHPKNKQEVGRRLSMWALGAVYGKPVAVSGPRFAGSEVKGSEVHLRFTHTDGGLVFKGDPKGFVVAGEDRKWQEATARLDGDRVIVSSAAVAKPVAARYAWADMPPSTLWNGAGLPASPFRTDDWPLDYGTDAKATATRGPRVIKVACVGDSITAGVGARDPRSGSYPAVLQERLGKRYEVRNFGVSARTMLRSGDHPYHKENAFREALAFKPDIVTILLGTNDSKPQNWAHKEDFIPSAKELIDAFKAANPRARIYVCLPVPAFPENFGITDKVIEEEVIPELRQLATAEKLPVIDLNKPMTGHAEMVPDKVHPNDAGYQLMADVLAKALVRKSVAK